MPVSPSDRAQYTLTALRQQAAHLIAAQNAYAAAIGPKARTETRVLLEDARVRYDFLVDLARTDVLAEARAIRDGFAYLPELRVGGLTEAGGPSA